MTRSAAGLVVLLLMVPLCAVAQTEDGPSTPGTYTGPATEGGLGAVLDDVPVTFDTGVIGIENDGTGNLLYTSTTTDEIGRMDTAGSQIEVLFTAFQGTDTNPIGVATDGSNAL